MKRQKPGRLKMGRKLSEALGRNARLAGALTRMLDEARQQPVQRPAVRKPPRE